MRKSKPVSVLIFCFFAFIAFDSTAGDIELDGLVINQTTTKAGDDFFRFFTRFWNPPSGVGEFTITINEKTNARLGTILFISVNDQQMKRVVLQRRSREIEETAKNSARGLSRYLSNFSGHTGQNSSLDLSGTGY